MADAKVLGAAEHGAAGRDAIPSLEAGFPLGPSMSEDALRPESGKRRQIIEGARKVFLKDGFDGASMNEIARVAGVSKGTLYVYFPGKEDLFAALIREEKRAQAEQLCHFARAETDLRTTLIAFGSRLLELVLRPESIAHVRIVAAVGAKFPGIGQAFYEAGPEFGRKRLAAFLARQVEDGRLAIPDPDIAAVQLGELCKSPFLLQAILGVGTRPTQTEIAAHIEQAVDMFLRAYASSV